MHDHVLVGLHAYADLTSVGSYCTVFDMIIEDLPEDKYSDRSWGLVTNPKSAIHTCLEGTPIFGIN